MRKPAQGSHFAISRKMGSPQIMVAFAVCVAFIILIAGCQEQEAIENRQLKKQVEQRDKEIEKQKELLDKCLREKKALEELSSEDIQDFMDDVLKSVGEENAKLQEENKKLKTKVGQLKTEILQLKRELEMHKGPTPLESGAD